jgi:hypothetical protein
MNTTAQSFVSQPLNWGEPLAYDLPASTKVIVAEQITGLEKREQQHPWIAP